MASKLRLDWAVRLVAVSTVRLFFTCNDRGDYLSPGHLTARHPILLEYSLDMDKLLMQMSFSGPVDVDVFDATTLTFVASSIASSGLTLTAGFVSATNFFCRL